jgi:hypothetical protein
MKFPYGLSNFYEIITEDYFYVDRTGHIPLVETIGKHLLFLRPRRFGKSLWLSTLENYYDVAKAAEFERLFGHLAIGQNPTPLHNHYLIMRWDFSLIQAQGTVQEIEQSLHTHINDRIRIFAQDYQDILGSDLHIDPNNAISSFDLVVATVRRNNHQMYLLIDEYDNFANEVMMSTEATDRQRYENLLYGEGIFKLIFKAVKAASASSGLDRVFITGVSPIVLSDITSGYNIAENIYFEPAFNDLCGFHEAEIAEALQQVVSECDLSAEEVAAAQETMRAFYNGYAFAFSTDRLIYNPTLALYFLKAFERNCAYPTPMLDSNLFMDQAKLAYIAHLQQGGQFLLDALNEEQPVVIRELAQRFGLAEMLSNQTDASFMGSLLYYLGILTLAGRTPFQEIMLRIPNQVARRLYVERVEKLLLPDVADQNAGYQAARTFFQTGQLQTLCDFVEQRYFKVLDNRDYRWADEMTLKTIFLTLLFNDNLYMIDSETPVERTYADLTLLVRPDLRNQPQLIDIVIEFKYIKLTDKALAGVSLQPLTSAALAALPSVQAKLQEAKTQLQDYRQKLIAQYGRSLRLRAYAIIALGFERIVWEEIK